MGEVYRAKDTRLDREVAVKVLPDQFANDPAALSRFEREAKAVAALSHPNVLAVYDVGREGDTSYVVTELLEGESLRQRLSVGPLPWRKAVSLAISVVDGLASAHAKGIVHRDLKPENIFLTTDGVVKILDFGLARMTPEGGASEQDAAHTPTVTIDTRPGTVMGTLNYMSPEQLRGKATDARSDIFSFGCVLYEMVAGRRAFRGETSADTMTAILRETPTSIRSKTENVGLELERVIERCLEKKAEQRFHSASDLGFTLKTILTGTETMPVAAGKGRLWGFAIPVAIAAVMLFAAGVWLAQRTWTSNQQNATDVISIRSIAVLPFDNLSNDPSQQMYVDAIWESITDDLAKIGALQVTASHTLRFYRDKNMSMPEIEDKLNVDAFVTGSALHSGSRVEVRVRLIRSSDGRQLWSYHYEFDKRDILTEQRKIAHAVADQIQIELSPAEQVLLGAAPRVVQSSYDAYVRGMEKVRLGTKEFYQEALTLFDQALVDDPDFALAHVGRSHAYHGLSSDYLAPKEAMPECRDAALKALEIDPTLADAHAMLGRYKMQYEWDFAAASDSFLTALEYKPSLADAHLGYAMYLVAMDRGPEALKHLNTVHELDRASLYSEFEYGVVSFMARDYSRTIRDMKAAITINPDWWGAHANIANAYSMTNDHESAIWHARKAEDLDRSPSNRAMMGGVLAVAGLEDEARLIYSELKEIEKTEYICPYELASIPLGLGDYDETFEEMDRACDARADCLAWLQVDPRLDPIRDDERFDRLLERVGFEPKGDKLLIIEDDGVHASALAILPFEDNSPTPHMWFASGLADAISSPLGRVNPSKLGVLGPETTAYYAQTDKPIQNLQEDLDVDFVLRGGIQIIQNDVRITAKLIHAEDLTSVWSDEFQGTMDDPFALQSMVAEKIIAGLPIELTGDERVRFEKRYVPDPNAELAYMQGRYHAPWDSAGVQNLEKAIDYFEEAIKIDKQYPLPYCGLADAKCYLTTWGRLQTSEIRSEVEGIVATALALDDSLPEAYLSAGVVAEFLNWDWPLAERSFERAIQLDQNHARVYLESGHLFLMLGRFDEAKQQFERALQLNPKRSEHHAGLGKLYVGTGQLSEAEPFLQYAFELNNESSDANIWLADLRQKQGRFDEAVAIIERVVFAKEMPELAMRAFLGNAYAMAGRLDDVRMQLTEMKKSQLSGHHMWFGELHAALGESDEAFRRLNQALEAREGWLPHIRFDPGLVHIRDDPRFAELHRKMGLGHVDLSYASNVPSP
jgi:serine/threonine protein kinase/tetratricopeptide (TPR) repeat protein